MTRINGVSMAHVNTITVTSMSYRVSTPDSRQESLWRRWYANYGSFGIKRRSKGGEHRSHPIAGRRDAKSPAMMAVFGFYSNENAFPLCVAQSESLVRERGLHLESKPQARVPPGLSLPAMSCRTVPSAYADCSDHGAAATALSRSSPPEAPRSPQSCAPHSNARSLPDADVAADG